MTYTTTISTKGQLVLPKPIRDSLDINPSDSLQIRLENDQIIITPTVSTQDMLGAFKAKEVINQQTIKATVKKAVQDKHHDRS